MENETLTDKKNTFKLPFMDTVVELSGNFDSGNLNSVSIDLQKNVSNHIHSGVASFLWQG